MPENSQMFHTLCSKKIRDANPKGSFTYRLSKVLKILKPESMHHTSMKVPVQGSDQNHRTIYGIILSNASDLNDSTDLVES